MTMTDQRLRAMLVATLRSYGYVVTAIDDSGIAGADRTDNTIALTWREVEELTLNLLIGRPNASIASDSV
jgi:hypothetical protein